VLDAGSGGSLGNILQLAGAYEVHRNEQLTKSGQLSWFCLMEVVSWACVFCYSTRVGRYKHHKHVNGQPVGWFESALCIGLSSRPAKPCFQVRHGNPSILGKQRHCLRHMAPTHFAVFLHKTHSPSSSSYLQTTTFKVALYASIRRSEERAGNTVGCPRTSFVMTKLKIPES